MPTLLHPGVYADLLGKQMAKHNAACWLVNTGWSGGPYGVGQRMKISYTRAMIRAILNGSLAQTPTTPDAIFGVNVPVSCAEVPNEVLQPRNTWADKEAYDRQARDLARRFNDIVEELGESRARHKKTHRERVTKLLVARLAAAAFH